MAMRLLLFVLIFSRLSPCFGQGDDGFHVFTDKKGNTISAKILSVNESRTVAQIQRGDGRIFSIEITTFSLDDQQYLREWLGLPSLTKPSRLAAGGKGRLRVFGSLRKGAPIHTEAADEFEDFVAVAATGAGWLGLRENGELRSFSGRDSGMEEVESMGTNTAWFAYLKEDGTVWANARTQAFPGVLEGVAQVAAGSGHLIARLRDGSVKVWGNRYKDASDGPVGSPLPVSGAVDIATCQDRAAVVDSDGIIHCWTIPKRGEEVNAAEIAVYSHRIGDGVVAVEGSIFHFLVLTVSGEVYEWTSGDPSRAVKPGIELGGPATAIRANGSTRAARLENGSWVAWGQNGSSGIVEKINSLGPVPDIAFFSEPLKDSDAYVVWIEPSASQ